MQNKLSIFQDGDLKETLDEIVNVSIELSQRTPVVGFHHRFYVPGWIGFIQETIVNKNMHKWRSEVFYKGKTYEEFGSWIVDITTKVVKLHLDEKPIEDNGADLTIYNAQSQVIIELTHILLNVWSDCAPEVANTPNRIVKDKFIKSLYGIIYNEAAVELNKIGFRRPPVSKSSEPGCLGELRVLGIRILGYIINIILFSLIFTLIFSIVEAFS